MKAVVSLRVQLGQTSFELPCVHPGDSGLRFKQITGLPSYRPHPRTPGAAQLPGFLHMLPIIDALEHQEHLVGRTPPTPFQDHQIPLQCLLFHLVDPVFLPHRPCPYLLIALSGICPALDLSKLVAALHHIVDAIELVVHQLCVSKVLD